MVRFASVVALMALLLAGLTFSPVRAAPSPALFWRGDTHRTVVIYVDFPDAPAAASALEHANKQILINTTANGYKNNLQHFYREMSYGRLQVSVDFALNPVSRNRWFRMPQQTSAYDKGVTSKSIQLLRDAIAVADREVDYTNYDSVLVTINAEATSIGCGFARGTRFGAMDKSKSRLNAPTAEKQINRAAEICANDPLWIAVHEFGHILGLPDLYSGVTRYMGGWDIMDGNVRFPAAPVDKMRGLGGWSRRALGFIQDDNVVGVGAGVSQTVTFGSVSSATLPRGAKRLLRINNPLTPATSPDKYLLVEVREPSGYDANVPGPGLLLSEVDEAIGDGEGTVRAISATGEPSVGAMPEALFKPTKPIQAARPGGAASAVSAADWTWTYYGNIAGQGRVWWQVGLSFGRRGDAYSVHVVTSRVTPNR